MGFFKIFSNLREVPFKKCIAVTDLHRHKASNNDNRHHLTSDLDFLFLP